MGVPGSGTSLGVTSTGTSPGVPSSGSVPVPRVPLPCPLCPLTAVSAPSRSVPGAVPRLLLWEGLLQGIPGIWECTRGVGKGRSSHRPMGREWEQGMGLDYTGMGFDPTEWGLIPRKRDLIPWEFPVPVPGSSPFLAHFPGLAIPRISASSSSSSSSSAESWGGAAPASPAAQVGSPEPLGILPRSPSPLPCSPPGISLWNPAPGLPWAQPGSGRGPRCSQVGTPGQGG